MVKASTGRSASSASKPFIVAFPALSGSEHGAAGAPVIGQLATVTRISVYLLMNAEVFSRMRRSNRSVLKPTS